MSTIFFIIPAQSHQEENLHLILIQEPSELVVLFEANSTLAFKSLKKGDCFFPSPHLRKQQRHLPVASYCHSVGEPHFLFSHLRCFLENPQCFVVILLCLLNQSVALRSSVDQKLIFLFLSHSYNSVKSCFGLVQFPRDEQRGSVMVGSDQGKVVGPSQFGLIEFPSQSMNVGERVRSRGVDLKKKSCSTQQIESQHNISLASFIIRVVYCFSDLVLLNEQLRQWGSLVKSFELNSTKLIAVLKLLRAFHLELLSELEERIKALEALCIPLE